jgi:hypothetical protein
MRVRARFCAYALLISSLAGCGTVVPDIAEPWDRVKDNNDVVRHGEPVIPVSATAQIEFEIKKQIYCELKAAVQTVDYWSKKTENTTPLLPHDWGASVSISLQVDESTALNPGAALNVPMANAVSTFGVVQGAGKTAITPPMTSTPQSFNLGFGATISSTATRIDKFDPYYSIKYLLRPLTLFNPDELPSYNNPAPLCQYDEATSDPLAQDGHSPATSSPLIPQGSTPLFTNNALNPKRSDWDPVRTDWKYVPHIVSQLGLVDWLVGATFANREIPSVTGPARIDKFKKYLGDERAKLSRLGFNEKQITDIIASGASSDDVSELVHNPKKEKNYSTANVTKYLLQGTTPTVLEEYKDAGYLDPEIDEMIMHCDRKNAAGDGGTNPSAPVKHSAAANPPAAPPLAPGNPPTAVHPPKHPTGCSTVGGGSTQGGVNSPGGGGGSSSGGGGTTPDTLSIEIKFIIVTNGNVTPTWKLLRVSANTTGSLLGLGRTRTHDVIITIGPNNQLTLNTHLASQIGNAVSNGNQAAALSTQ